MDDDRFSEGILWGCAVGAVMAITAIAAAFIAAGSGITVF